MLSLISDFAARENQINIGGRASPDIGHGRCAQEIAKAQGEAAAGLCREDRRARSETAPPAEPTPLHRIVAFLCHLALTSGAGAAFLGEQFETLHEANRWLEGIPLLETILGAAPDPVVECGGERVSRRSSRMPTGSRWLMRRRVWKACSLDGMQAAEHALALLSGTVLQRRDAAVKAALKQAGTRRRSG